MRQYKMRKFKNGNDNAQGEFNNYNVTVPTDIARALEAEFGDDFRFEAEQTDEGILYRVVEPRAVEVPVADLKIKRGKASEKPEAKVGAKPKAKPAAPKATAKKPAASAKKPAAKASAAAKKPSVRGKATAGAKPKVTRRPVVRVPA